MLRRGLTATFLTLVLATVAYAVNKGDVLYIKARNTSLKKGPEPTANVLAVLQPGTPVTYVGPSAKAKGWHEVTAGKRDGFVYQANLAQERPNTEIATSDGGQAIDPQAFASSGAATKALGEGAVNYGTKTKPDYARAVADIEVAERIAKSISDRQLASHEKAANLHPMVGEPPKSP